jgi:hypothetical protein
LERGNRIELSALAWKAKVLPLYEPRINSLMKYYAPIPLDNLKTIQEKVFSLFPKEKLYANMTSLFYIPNDINSFLNIPELQSELDRLGWTSYVYSIAFFIVQPTKGTSIHIDTGDVDHSFNLPILNCNNTFVNFYTTLGQPIKQTYSEYSKTINYFSYNPATCNLVDKLEMTTPHVIKVKEVHNITNINTGPRITLLIRLKSNLDLSYLFE